MARKRNKYHGEAEEEESKIVASKWMNKEDEGISNGPSSLLKGIM